MAKIIELPKLSPTMEEGTLVRWAKKEGDAVAIDDLLAEVETDKATMEFRAFDKGTLLARLVPEGTVAKLGQPVAIFGEPGEDVSALVSAQPTGGHAAAPAPAKKEAADTGDKQADADAKPAAEKGDATPEAKEAEPPAEKKAEPASKAEEPAKKPAKPAAPAQPTVRSLVAASQSGKGGLLLLAPTADGAAEGGGPSSPRVRKSARELGVDLDHVQGSGEHGRITVDDVARAASKPASSSAAAAKGAVDVGEADTERPASSMRKTIARRLTEAKQSVPHFYLEADLDVEALGALREQLNEGVEKNQRVSVTDLLLRACALALREVPASNASWRDGTIVEHHRCDLSLAVAIDDGLVTPVLRAVDKKSIRTISAEVRELAERARARKLKPEEMTGGVFSLSNLGMYGVDRFSAVINPPEGMILAVGATRSVPVVRNGQVVPGQMCAVTLSCDHRVVDGALGAQFLKALRGLVEKPLKILA